jgi:drug/metabolite transporter (DMT)-like permease
MEETLKQPPVSRVYSALFLVQVLFGINFVTSKVVVTHMPPLIWAFGRTLISACILLLFAVCFYGKIQFPKKDQILKFVLFSLLGIVINQGFFLTGLHYTTSSNSAILTTMIPIFTLVLAVFRKTEKATPRIITGFLLSFAGVLIIRNIEDFSITDKTFIGDMMIVANALSFAFFLELSKNFLQEIGTIWGTIWLLIFGSFGLLLVSLPDWVNYSTPHWDAHLLSCALFSIFGATLLTYFLNSWTLIHAKSSTVALFIYFQPIIAMILAFFYLKEAVTMRQVISSLLIFSGIFLSTQRTKKTG